MADGRPSEYWLQRLIAVGLDIHLSRQEILHEYAFDELLAVCDEYAAIHTTQEANTTAAAEEW